MSARAGLISAVVLAAVALMNAGPHAHAATLTLLNLDGDGEGLNDPTPAVPVGGNTGTTLGEQRSIALRHAADVWEQQLRSAVEIRVAAKFDPMGGNALSAVLGIGGPVAVFRDFPGAPLVNTFYPAALANSLAGVDVDPARNDVSVIFNTDVDGVEVLGPLDFYYGLDRLAGADIDFVSVALHELAHGLGFITLVNLNTGAKRACGNGNPSSCDDPYLVSLVDDNFSPARLSDMTDEQRADAMSDAPDLLWDGPNVVAASAPLADGARPDGRVEVHAPSPAQPGSSVVHFSTSLSPNELMEPAYSAPNHEVGLTTALMADLGWRLVEETTTTSSTTSTSFTTTTIADPECGDANRDGRVTATDARIALQTAVGTNTCPVELCDADASGAVTASDAQRILKFAVGEPVAMSCP